MTLALVFPDNVLRERLQFTLIKYPNLKPFFCRELFSSLTADCIVVPAEQYLSFGKFNFKCPIVCYGGEALLESAFKYGSFDYLKDPWQGTELIARIHRITQFHGEKFELLLKDYFLIGPIKRIKLTEKEAIIFECLKKASGSVVERKTLESHCNIEISNGSRSIDMLISRLRRKIADILVDSDYFSAIRSVRNEGYRLTSFCCEHVVDNSNH